MRRKSGEPQAVLISNFTRKVKRSGVLKEARARNFHSRKISRTKRRLSAIHRDKKRAEVERSRKMGISQF